MKTKTSESKSNSSIVIDGVTIKWNDSRYMPYDHDDPTENYDLRGSFCVTLSMDNVDLEGAKQAIAYTQRLHAIAQAGDLFCPVPGSTHALKLKGLDGTGVPRWQIIADGRKCDIVSSTDLLMMDPSRYSKSGDIAMRTIAWMRAVGRITSEWRSKDDMFHVFNVWDEITLKEAKLQFCPLAKVTLS